MQRHAPVQAEAARLLVDRPAGVRSSRRIGSGLARMPQLPGLMPAPVSVHRQEQHLRPVSRAT